MTAGVVLALGANAVRGAPVAGRWPDALLYLLANLSPPGVSAGPRAELKAGRLDSRGGRRDRAGGPAPGHLVEKLPEEDLDPTTAAQQLAPLARKRRRRASVCSSEHPHLHCDEPSWKPWSRPRAETLWCCPSWLPETRSSRSAERSGSPTPSSRRRPGSPPRTPAGPGPRPGIPGRRPRSRGPGPGRATRRKAVRPWKRWPRTIRRPPCWQPWPSWKRTRRPADACLADPAAEFRAAALERRPTFPAPYPGPTPVPTPATTGVCAAGPSAAWAPSKALRRRPSWPAGWATRLARSA